MISALPLPSVEHLAPSLVENARWKPAVAAMPGIATMAAQIWTNVTNYELGLPHLEGTDRTCGTAAVQPLGLADMTDVLATENWPADDTPKGLFYVCGPMPHRGPWPAPDEHETPDLLADEAKATFTQWLRTAASVFPASATDPFVGGAFDPALLYVTEGVEAEGSERVDFQYWRANADPNERYVPSPPGSGALRPESWNSGASNLALASDWISTGMDIGSFEGAVMSGLLAAHALTGLPALDQIVGYDFARPHRAQQEGKTTIETTATDVARPTTTLRPLARSPAPECPPGEPRAPPGTGGCPPRPTTGGHPRPARPGGGRLARPGEDPRLGPAHRRVARAAPPRARPDHRGAAPAPGHRARPRRHLGAGRPDPRRPARPDVGRGGPPPASSTSSAPSTSPSPSAPPWPPSTPGASSTGRSTPTT